MEYVFLPEHLFYFGVSQLEFILKCPFWEEKTSVDQL